MKSLIFDSLSGLGIHGQIATKEMLIGNIKLMEQNTISARHNMADHLQLSDSGKNLLVSWDQSIKGIIGVADTAKEKQ